jgi:hypothetical protein
MSEPARHLTPVSDSPPLIVVNPETGERVGMLADYRQELEDTVAGLQRDVRGWAARYAELKRDKDAEAEESPCWPAALRVFEHWRRQCNHPRSEFSLDRFEMIRPHLERLSRAKKGRPDSAEARLAHAEALCKLAVDGLAHDPFVTTRKNGTPKRHTGFHLAFETADRFEERCNAAPIERIREVIGQPKPEQTTLDQAQGT